MQVTSMESVRNAPAGVIQNNNFALHRPVARESPGIERQLRRRRVSVRLVPYRSTGRCEVLRTLVAHIVFLRPQIVPIGGNFSAAGMNGNQIARNARASGFSQKFLNNSFGWLILSFAENVVPNA